MGWYNITDQLFVLVKKKGVDSLKACAIPHSLLVDKIKYTTFQKQQNNFLRSTSFLAYPS